MDGTVTVALDENPTARDLIDRLPLTVDFEDFHTSEKISYLDAPLTTEGSGGSAPGPGDLIYYVPWGNLAVFYDGSVPHSDDTIPLGRVVDGAENVASLDRGPVTIERVAQKGNR
ncbi:cyclophilin-like fold protein [Nocardioides marmoraquaticus]